MEKRNATGLAQQGMLGILVFFLSSTVAYGATYYVRANGNDGNLGTTNDSGGAWRTIDYAADHVSAGDVVRVQAGTYAERVTPGVNGTSVTNTVTFVADGAVTVCGWTFSGNSYIRVIGFVVDTNAGCSLNVSAISLGGTNSYLEFWNNTIQDAGEEGIRLAFWAGADYTHNSLFIGNEFQRIGLGAYCGSGSAFDIRGNNNLIAYNNVHDVDPDAFRGFGTYNRWTNNYVHGLTENCGGHPDAFQTSALASGWAHNLLEAFFLTGSGTSANEHLYNISNASSGGGAMTQNVIRRNVVHSMGDIDNIFGSYGVTYTRQYHNTRSDVGLNPANQYTVGLNWASGASNGYLYNNVEYKSWGSSATTGVGVYDLAGGATYDYNLAYSPSATITFASGWASQAHERSNADPYFTDYANHDFTIGNASSQAIGNAGPLTAVSGSGSGTTFNLAANGGGFFLGDNTNLSQYGGNLVVGDTITVGTDVVTIASISGDAITATSSFTWANGDPVFFGSDATPDIGAYPYKAGGYALTASYSKSAGTVAVTPSDASLVRFVVCYEDGIPATVDSSAPFTCSAGSGSLDVRVYPLYASKTLSVAAQLGPSAPRNVVIK